MVSAWRRISSAVGILVAGVTPSRIRAFLFQASNSPAILVTAVAMSADSTTFSSLAMSLARWPEWVANWASTVSASSNCVIAVTWSTISCACSKSTIALRLASAPSIARSDCWVRISSPLSAWYVIQ